MVLHFFPPLFCQFAPQLARVGTKRTLDTWQQSFSARILSRSEVNFVSSLVTKEVSSRACANLFSRPVPNLYIKVPRYFTTAYYAYCDCLLRLPGLPTAFATCNRIFAMSVTSRTTKERTKMVKTGGPWGKDAWPQSHSWVMMQLMTSHNDGVWTLRWPRPNWQQLPRGLVQSLRLMLLHAPGRFFQMDESKWKDIQEGTQSWNMFQLSPLVKLCESCEKPWNCNILQEQVCQRMHSVIVKLRAYRMLMFSWFVCSGKTECSVVAAKWQQLNQQSPT